MKTIALSLPFVLACASDPARNPVSVSHTSRDSSGVEIVESIDGMWQKSSPWSIDFGPEFVIGGEGNEDSTQLLSMVTGGMRYPDGRVAIALMGTSEIRVYDTRGVWMNNIGRTGRGPGEFGELRSIYRYRGDSIVAFDGMRNAMLVFDNLGKWVSSARIKGAVELSPGIVGALNDGRLVAYWPARGESSVANNRSNVSLSRFSVLDRQGTIATELGIKASGRSRFAMQRVTLEAPLDTLFEAVPRIVTRLFGNSFVYADAAHFEIHIHDESGRLRRIVRLMTPPDTIPASAKHDTSTVWTQIFAQGSSRRVSRRPAVVVWPLTYPAFADLKLDLAGNLWVMKFPKGSQTGNGDSWLVFNAAGRLCGAVVMPTGLSPMEIGDSYVLGRARDSLGVESVRLHNLRKQRPDVCAQPSG